MHFSFTFYSLKDLERSQGWGSMPSRFKAIYLTITCRILGIGDLGLTSHRLSWWGNREVLKAAFKAKPVNQRLLTPSSVHPQPLLPWQPISRPKNVATACSLRWARFNQDRKLSVESQAAFLPWRSVWSKKGRIFGRWLLNFRWVVLTQGCRAIGVQRSMALASSANKGFRSGQRNHSSILALFKCDFRHMNAKLARQCL